jgi:hypothetical protein
MNGTNRLFIALAAATWIVIAVAVVFLTWAAPERTIDRLDDVVTFLRDNNTTAGQLIVTLAASAIAILALLLIIVEFAPEDEPRELRVEQAGATTIIPAEALRMRLEEALLTLPEVTAARSHVLSRDKGIAATLDLTVTPAANVGELTQQAVRVVVDTVQADLGLPVSGTPKVKVAFGGPKPGQPTAATGTPFVEAAPSPPAHADASPGPLIYDESPPEHPPQT